MDTHYDLIVVGTGFAGSFFLDRYLSRMKRPVRVLCLEAGAKRTHAEQLAEGNPLRAKHRQLERISRQFVNETPEKPWVYYDGYGGGSNCWYACTPRQMPEDFHLESSYGVGRDWPLRYEDLEPYYCDAEDMMTIGADSDDTPYPRSRPYPAPPHRMSHPDKVLKKALPNGIFSFPAARTYTPVPDQRPACCNNSVCRLCPVDAKFTILNGMKGLHERSGVELQLGASVQRVWHERGVAKGVEYTRDGDTHTVQADLVVLAANAMFNPFILLNSDLDGPEVGRGLCEQCTRSAFLRLDGLGNFQGSTISNALGYTCYTGERRRDRAGALVQSINTPQLLNIRGEWAHTLRLNFIYEDHRLPENRVTMTSPTGGKPKAEHHRRSPQTEKGLASIEEDLKPYLDALPVKSYELGPPWETESHIQGTTVMGNDPATSVIDSDCVHHRVRNLVLLGSGAFPTAAPANPTLTLSAMALRTADRLTA